MKNVTKNDYIVYKLKECFNPTPSTLNRILAILNVFNKSTAKIFFL